MKALHPNRTLFILFGIGTVLVFLLGAGAWHAILQADPPGCTENELACLFIPTRFDYGIHLISYALMTPLMVTMFLWFSAWRRQWVQINVLTKNLSAIAVRDDKLEKVASGLGLKGRVQLLDSDDYFSFCARIVSPHIFLSRAVVKALNAEELEALLLHEKYHLENRDPLKILLGRLIISALFFAPVLRDLFQRYLIGKEIAADRFAVGFQGHHRGIVSALQKLLEQQTRIGRVNLAVAGTEALAHRINSILGRAHNERILLSRVAISFLAPALTIASILAPIAVLRP
jgi:Zn-dependent protease with chaperone function